VFSDGKIIRITRTRLQSLGLKSLVQIGGGNVVIAGNERLCFAHSVNWTALRIEGKTGRTFVVDNRNSTLCGTLSNTLFNQSINQKIFNVA